MSKFAKSIFIATGLVVLVYALAVLGLNIYLQSSGLQGRLKSAAESAAGSPINIQGAHYTPWAGFQISGVSLQGKSLPGQPPFLTATSVSFRFSLLALLQGKLVVNELLVRDPALVRLAQKPTPQAADTSPGKPAPAATPVVILVDQPSSGVEITVPEQPSPLLSPKPLVQVKKVRLTNGSAQFLDPKGAQVLSLNGIDLKGNLLPDLSVSGTFRVSKATVGGILYPHSVRGTFRWKQGQLILPDLKADWAGGQIEGSLEREPDNSLVLLVAAEGIQLKMLATDAGLNGDGSRGALSLKGSLEGKGGAPDTFSGSASASVQEARFLPFEPIRQIGELLGIQELQVFELKTAEATFDIRDQKVFVESLKMESDNLILDAEGPIEFDGRLKLRARLHMNEKLRRNLSGLLGGDFKDSEYPGYQQIPFGITGPISRPKSDLLDKLTGFRIGQDVGGLLKNLFKMPQPKKEGASKKAGGN